MGYLIYSNIAEVMGKQINKLKLKSKDLHVALHLWKQAEFCLRPEGFHQSISPKRKRKHENLAVELRARKHRYAYRRRRKTEIIIIKKSWKTFLRNEGNKSKIIKTLAWG